MGRKRKFGTIGETVKKMRGKCEEEMVEEVIVRISKTMQGFLAAIDTQQQNMRGKQLNRNDEIVYLFYAERTVRHIRSSISVRSQQPGFRHASKPMMVHPVTNLARSDCLRLVTKPSPPAA